MCMYSNLMQLELKECKWNDEVFEGAYQHFTFQQFHIISWVHNTGFPSVWRKVKY